MESHVLRRFCRRFRRVTLYFRAIRIRMAIRTQNAQHQRKLGRKRSTARPEKGGASVTSTPRTAPTATLNLQWVTENRTQIITYKRKKVKQYLQAQPLAIRALTVLSESLLFAFVVIFHRVDITITHNVIFIYRIC